MFKYLSSGRKVRCIEDFLRFLCGYRHFGLLLVWDKCIESAKSLRRYLEYIEIHVAIDLFKRHVNYLLFFEHQHPRFVTVNRIVIIANRQFTAPKAN
ncbi:Uncharacterised protein [Salmonella enterica subsp. enterica serovar Typhi]|nr:Uncharacterised protein [Salmonella enterica subsp. enterica serovar Typhi]CHS37059.1 Uncharacterised protein [Salmonella enterica subsp. enterica serovar Typhi]CHY35491.1 Uncharacterised protein [Salmonella enterica subsp. enterica serovar Typhi]